MLWIEIDERPEARCPFCGCYAPEKAVYTADDELIGCDACVEAEDRDDIETGSPEDDDRFFDADL